MLDSNSFDQIPAALSSSIPICLLKFALGRRKCLVTCLSVTPNFEAELHATPCNVYLKTQDSVVRVNIYFVFVYITA